MSPPFRLAGRHLAVLLPVVGAACRLAPLARASTVSVVPKPTVIKSDDCFNHAKPAKPIPISSTSVSQRTGPARVDIRGSLKVKHGQIGPLSVGGCSNTINHLLGRTYVLVKAPTSNAYIVALTHWRTPDGSKHALAAPTFANASAFAAAVAPLPQKLTIPGINGTVYGPLGSPFALMATKASGKPYSHSAKLALAKAYIATGGFATPAGV